MRHRQSYEAVYMFRVRRPGRPLLLLLALFCMAAGMSAGAYSQLGRASSGYGTEWRRGPRPTGAAWTGPEGSGELTAEPAALEVTFMLPDPGPGPDSDPGRVSVSIPMSGLFHPTQVQPMTFRHIRLPAVPGWMNPSREGFHLFGLWKAKSLMPLDGGRIPSQERASSTKELKSQPLQVPPLGLLPPGLWNSPGGQRVTEGLSS